MLYEVITRTLEHILDSTRRLAEVSMGVGVPENLPEYSARVQPAAIPQTTTRITSYNVCYTKLLRGDPLFRKTHGIRYPYVAGAMANGITSVEMVEAAARGGMLGFFGAAGLSPDAIESAVDRLQKSLGNLPFGSNLIHSPNDPAHEWATVELYLV